MLYFMISKEEEKNTMNFNHSSIKQNIEFSIGIMIIELFKGKVYKITTAKFQKK